jgi:hypothetical protein
MAWLRNRCRAGAKEQSADKAFIRKRINFLSCLNQMISPEQNLLMYVVLPLWLLAGVADWMSHKKTHIEKNSGATESMLHIALILEMALPILAALFLRVNAAFFLLSGIALLIHQITVYIDLKYSYSRRPILPVEQMIHGVQEVLPLTGVLMLAGLYWGQFMALFGVGSEPADLAIVAKDDPLPLWYTLIASAAGFGVTMLFIEEWVRCVRFKKAPINSP